MSTIHFVGGEKGGVGKSVVARLLSQYFLDTAQPHLALDADQSHPTLTRYYEAYTRPLNLDFFESIDQIMELALEEQRQVLVDLPAQSQRFLDRWIEDNAVLEMSADAGIPVVFWYVVDDGRDSANLWHAFVQRYAPSMRCVLVMNHGCGSDFSAVSGLPETDTGNDTWSIRIPALHEGTMRTVDQLNFSFWAAANLNDGPGPHLSLMERQRSRVWLRKAYAEIERTLAAN